MNTEILNQLATIAASVVEPHLAETYRKDLLTREPAWLEDTMLSYRKAVISSSKDLSSLDESRFYVTAQDYDRLEVCVRQWTVLALCYNGAFLEHRGMSLSSFACERILEAMNGYDKAKKAYDEKYPG